MLQRVASHASRYKRVCPLMAPFTRILHGACKNHPHPQARFALTRKEWMAVWMMRILLILSALYGCRFTRSFRSFAQHLELVQWVLEYDACLTGVGMIWFRVVNGHEVAVGCCAVSLVALGFEQVGSGLMNTAEFIAATLGVRGLIAQGVRDTGIKLRGDNKSALAWAHHKSFKSDYAMRAAIVHVAQNVKAGIEVVGTEHLPHTREYDFNWRTDLASRGTSWNRIRELDGEDKVSGTRLGPEMVEWEIPGAEEVLRLCDPLSRQEGDEAFTRRVLEMRPPSGADGKGKGGVE
jgi:hypothetical protein